MALDARDFAGQEPWEQGPSAAEQMRFQQMHDRLLRRRGGLRGQQEQLWACVQAMQWVLRDLRVLQAWLLSVEVLLERTGEVEWPPMVERLARELVGELAPDPHDAQRWQLNQLLERSSNRRDD
jgi:hypothetical protein